MDLDLGPVLVARLQRGRKDVVRLRGRGQDDRATFCRGVSDPLRHGVSDKCRSESVGRP
jgi:hypothetical protein